MMWKKLLLILAVVLAPSSSSAQKTIDQLSVGSALGGTEQIPMFQTANPAVTTTPSAIATYFASASLELTNKTLTSAVGKGTWTASGTWTLPAFTLGGTVSGGGNQINNVVIGNSTPLAGTFTTLTGTAGSITGLTALAIRDTSAAFDVTLAATSSATLTAGRTLTLDMGNVAHTLAFGTTANTITFPSVASDTVVMLAASQELTNKTLTSAVGKGTWTASGTWTLPAHTLGGTVSGGGNQINNVVIGTATPLAGTFTVLTGTSGSITGLTTLAIRDTSAAFDVTFAAVSSSALTAGRTLTIDMVNAARTLKLGANLTLATDPGGITGALKSNGTGTFAQAAASDLSNGTTGSGSVVLATTPTFVTNLTSPLVIGGSAAGSTLILESTSGTGTTDAIQFKTGSQLLAGFVNSSGQWSMGTNTAANPLANLQSGTILAVTGADAAVARVAITTAGTGVLPVLNFYGSRGTVASPTATQSADNLWALAGAGYGTSYQTGGGSGIISAATENFDGTHGGSNMVFRTTPNGTTTVATAMTIQASGGVSIGNATDPAAGGLDLNGQLYVPNITTSSAAQSGTVCWSSGGSPAGKFTADTTLGCLASSARWKHDIKPWTESALDILVKLQPSLYEWNKPIGLNQDGTQLGMIAEQVWAVDRRLAGIGDDGNPRAWRQDAVVTLLVRAVQELKSDNDNLRVELRKLAR